METQFSSGMSLLMGYHISTNHIHVSNTEWIQKAAIIYVFVYINVAVISKEKEQQI